MTGKRCSLEPVRLKQEKIKNITLTVETMKIMVFQQPVCCRYTWRVDLLSFPLVLERHFLCLFSFLGSS